MLNFESYRLNKNLIADARTYCSLCYRCIRCLKLKGSTAQIHRKKKSGGERGKSAVKYKTFGVLLQKLLSGLTFLCLIVREQPNRKMTLVSLEKIVQIFSHILPTLRFLYDFPQGALTSTSVQNGIYTICHDVATEML